MTNQYWADKGNEHNKRLLGYVQQIKKLFTDANKDLINLSGRVVVSGVFVFEQHPLINGEADRILRRLATDIINLIIEAEHTEGRRANEALNALIMTMPEGIRSHPGYNQQNEETINEFAYREVRGRTMPERILSYVQDYKSTIELIITEGQDKSRTQLINQANYALTRPLPLLGRTQRTIQSGDVTMAVGAYLLSNRAGVMNPGRGVYRSKFLDISRIATTDINALYRVATEERFRQIDFIVGYKLKTAKDLRVCPVCRALDGSLWPTDAKLEQVHILCRCILIPLYKSTLEIEEDNRRIVNGLDPLPASSSVNYVSRPSDDVYRWINLNRDFLNRQAQSGNLYSWISDNPQFFNETLYTI